MIDRNVDKYKFINKKEIHFQSKRILMLNPQRSHNGQQNSITVTRVLKQLPRFQY